MPDLKYDDSYIGRKYWYYTILGFDEKHNFICQCDCGNIKHIVPIWLMRGTVKSCGCMRNKLLHDNNTVHGCAISGHVNRLYRIYGGMKRRCYNSKSHRYQDYGGRGIVICNEWLSSFAVFRDWALSHGYSDDLSIDRIDVNGNYEPENCRWADAKTQRANQRQRKRKLNWTINGITKSAIEWCEEYGLSMQFVMYRINNKYMTPFEAITTPKLQSGRPSS